MCHLLFFYAFGCKTEIIYKGLKKKHYFLTDIRLDVTQVLCSKTTTISLAGNWEMLKFRQSCDRLTCLQSDYCITANVVLSPPPIPAPHWWEWVQKPSAPLLNSGIPESFLLEAGSGQRRQDGELYSLVTLYHSRLWCLHWIFYTFLNLLIENVCFFLYNRQHTQTKATR